MVYICKITNYKSQDEKRTGIRVANWNHSILPNNLPINPCLPGRCR